LASFGKDYTGMHGQQNMTFNQLEKRMMYDLHEIVWIHDGQFWLACRLPNTYT